MLILAFCVELYPIRIKAYKALKDNHFCCEYNRCSWYSCPNVTGSFGKVLGFLSAEGVFIEYMYSFANNNVANVVIRPAIWISVIEVLKKKRKSICWLRADYKQVKPGD